MKLKLKQVVPKPNNTTIVIYYSHAGQEMRYPTGVSISSEKNSKREYKDWDYSKNMLKTYVADFETKKAKINALVEKANAIISEKYKMDILLSKKELEELLTQEEQFRTKNIAANFSELYPGFLEMKRQQFEANNSIQSLKDFTSTRNLLYDYEAYKGRKYKVYEIDNLWFKDFTNFMRLERAESIGEYKYHTKGNMADKTIKKRYDVLSQYFDYLKDLKINVTDTIDKLKKYKSREIKPIRTDKVTLNIQEIHQLYKFNFDDKKLENIRDVFVFDCFTGIRFEDLRKFDKQFIEQKDEGFIYKKIASKTKHSSAVKYVIPLCDIALEILKKYNYKLPIISNQKSNDYLKEALKKTGYFDGVTELQHKDTGEYKRRYEAITMHKGRDTFISNLVDTTPLNELMKYTGHTKLSTLQGYIDTNREVKMNYIKAFNQPK